jgi:peptide/nickel transport system substrate-binding protein
MKKSSYLFLLVVLVMASAMPGAIQAQGGKTVVMGSLVDVYNIDPAVGFDQAIGSTLKQLYDALFRYVGNPPQVVPWVADTWEVSSEARVYDHHAAGWRR